LQPKSISEKRAANIKTERRVRALRGVWFIIMASQADGNPGNREWPGQDFEEKEQEEVGLGFPERALTPGPSPASGRGVQVSHVIFSQPRTANLLPSPARGRGAGGEGF
jgi:hypothetical protein